MALNKDKNKKWEMNFSPEDFTPVTDETIIVAAGPDGNQAGINLWMYANYFFNNIQERVRGTGSADPLNFSLPYYDSYRLQIVAV